MTISNQQLHRLITLSIWGNEKGDVRLLDRYHAML